MKETRRSALYVGNIYFKAHAKKNCPGRTAIYPVITGRYRALKFAERLKMRQLMSQRCLEVRFHRHQCQTAKKELAPLLGCG